MLQDIWRNGKNSLKIRFPSVTTCAAWNLEYLQNKNEKCAHIPYFIILRLPYFIILRLHILRKLIIPQRNS